MATVEITFPSSSGHPMRGALVVPAGGGPRPGVLVLHEIFGLNEDIRRLAGRVAALGYVALAPDLYDTGGPKPLCVLRTLLAASRGEGPAFADLDAARAWLAARPEVDGTRLAVVGFCLGGGFALLYAVRAPLKAAGVFYGDVPATADALRGACPIVAGYGGRDRVFAPRGRRLARLLDEIGVPHDVRVYPDAGHSFMSRHEGVMAVLGAWGPMAASFDPAAEADSWDRLARWFRTHLDGAGAS